MSTETTVEQTTEVDAIVKIEAGQYGLQATEAAQVESVFLPMIKAMSELELEFNEIANQPITKELCKKAKTLRLKYVKIRTGTAEIHKKAKAYYLAGGRFVDGWKNAQAFASQGKETKLAEIEEHFERIEKERIEALEKERMMALFLYADTYPEGMGYWNQEQFDLYLEGAKIAHKKKQEAEAKREKLEFRINSITALGATTRDGKIELANVENDDFSNVLTIEQIEAAEEEVYQAYLEEFKATATLNADYNQRLKAENQRLKAELAQTTAQTQTPEPQQKPEPIQNQRDKDRLLIWIEDPGKPMPPMNTKEGAAIAKNLGEKFAGFKKWATNELKAIN